MRLVVYKFLIILMGYVLVSLKKCFLEVTPGSELSWCINKWFFSILSKLTLTGNACEIIFIFQSFLDRSNDQLQCFPCDCDWTKPIYARSHRFRRISLTEWEKNVRLDNLIQWLHIGINVFKWMNTDIIKTILENFGIINLM